MQPMATTLPHVTGKGTHGGGGEEGVVQLMLRPQLAFQYLLESPRVIMGFLLAPYLLPLSGKTAEKK